MRRIPLLLSLNSSPSFLRFVFCELSAHKRLCPLIGRIVHRARAWLDRFHINNRKFRPDIKEKAAATPRRWSPARAQLATASHHSGLASHADVVAPERLRPGSKEPGLSACAHAGCG